ncbi:MAG TPA: hypothetical protein VFP68_10590 [Burkholderiaceae bacterium]|nr:hypothetical protein [Burkholderiaceae bacterium]
MPSLREKHHNRFEFVHRFGGWSVLALFWMHAGSTYLDSLDHTLASFPFSGAFWLLYLLTMSIASPWLRLRRVKVKVERPSSHAVILRFKKGEKPFAGSSTALSLSPLMEWHSFANIPTPDKKGFRIIVSRAGDWTGRLIDDPPRHIWMKGITTAGVANVEVLFKRVVYVATGSGIGPVLPHLLRSKVPIHLIWATRSPEKTYGMDLVNEILDSTPDACIWDTDTQGKPDLANMALSAVAKFNAEAVIVISNRKLTETVIRAVELKGVPAYGAIWDS